MLPQRNTWSDAGISARDMEYDTDGVYLVYNQKDKAFYPLTKFLNGGTGKPDKGVPPSYNPHTLYWSSSPGESDGKVTVYEANGLLVGRNPGFAQPLGYAYRSAGGSVRCIRE